MLNQQLPLVSIIIPTFNRAHLIRDTLNSVIAQTYNNWECIVVDDGSIDNTSYILNEYVSKDNRFKYVVRPNDRIKGANACRNYGLELSEGRYINWFDDDDLMHPDKLQMQIKALEKGEFSFSICQTKIFEEDKDNIIGLKSENLDSNKPLLDFITLDMIFLTQAPIFDKNFLILNKLYFDEDLQAAQEWEFISRVLYYSSKFHISTLPLVLFRKHSNSISHGMDYKIRKWHYFLARKKIYEFLKPITIYKDKLEIEDYLIDYIKTYFRELIFSKEYKRIIKIYVGVIAPMYSIISNIKITVFICFVFLTGLGYNYREKIVL